MRRSVLLAMVRGMTGVRLPEQTSPDLWLLAIHLSASYLREVESFAPNCVDEEDAYEIGERWGRAFALRPNWEGR